MLVTLVSHLQFYYFLLKLLIELLFSLFTPFGSMGNLIFCQLARETLSFWVKAFSEDTAKRLENFGFIQFRPGGISQIDK